jgi:hypothetical protein
MSKLTERESQRQRHVQEGDDRGRYRNDAAPSQRVPGVAGNTRSWEIDMEQTRQSFPKKPTLMKP